MATTEDRAGMEVVYELGYLVLPSVAVDNVPSVVSNLVSIITKAGAQPLDSEDPMLEQLAYSMSKTVGARKYVVDEAYIGWMKFEADPMIVEGIKKSVDQVEEVLRSLLIKAPRESAFTFAEARAKREAREAEMQPAAGPAQVQAEMTEEAAPAEVAAVSETVVE